jgi:hypothetical protein
VQRLAILDLAVNDPLKNHRELQSLAAGLGEELVPWVGPTYTVEALRKFLNSCRAAIAWSDTLFRAPAM